MPPDNKSRLGATSHKGFEILNFKTKLRGVSFVLMLNVHFNSLLAVERLSRPWNVIVLCTSGKKEITLIPNCLSHIGQLLKINFIFIFIAK